MKRVLPPKVEEGLQCAVGWLLGSGVGGDEGSAGQRQLARAPGWLRKRSEAECGAFLRWLVLGVGLVMSKGGKRASMVALPQPAANGSLCGCGSWLGCRVGCANGAKRRAAPMRVLFR